MTPDLEAAYEAAMQPFIQDGSAIKPEHLRARSWRYFVEINSACNLRCPSCARGNKAGYDQKIGRMDMDLLRDVLDKIRNENNKAIVFLYGNSEPFLHPQLPECIREVKSRGLRCEFSSNLNHVNRLDETLEANPDFIMVSLSGFSQEVYSRGHAGGDIDKVKANMQLLSEAKAKANNSTHIAVNYHLYNDNGGSEVEKMKEFAEILGFEFVTCIARAISMENAIQYCREKELERTGKCSGYTVLENHPDYNAMLPAVSPQWHETMERLRIDPTEAQEMFKQFPIHPVCPVGDAFTYVRHDGLVSMCACVDDRRLNFGKFLEKNQEELSEMRRGHPICQQCLKYRMNLYFHIADKPQWDAKK